MTTKKKIESKNEEIKEVKDVKKTSKKKMVKVEAPGVNVREESNLTSEILGVAVAGEKFDLVEKDLGTGFHKIMYNKKIAFIKAEFVKIV